MCIVICGDPKRSQPIFSDLCASHGILYHRTVRHNPQQNGVAERMNRTIMDTVSIPMEVESNPEPSQEPTSEPETQVEPVIPSSVPDTNEPELEGSHKEEEHPEAQAQALRDY
ncbi:hypothetical protein M9H77_16793 [Catharanthus roseus]|uniref:Uncharacterized protein n=1 Tax=Catharanthus roseus TaxID=4058 RepID=A0ACC0B2R5_CATRO|nr:hypothetical protein M9H77_16793 [Catharanthus roseus]